MSTGRFAFAIAGFFLIASSCIEGFDSFNGSDEAYYRLYDYVIDRPRVLGITYWPPFFSGGEVVEFSALAATPDDLIDPRVEWWGCGLSVDVPFSYYGADCLESSLAEYLGTGATLTYRMPYYDVSSCREDYSCYGYLPVFAIVVDDSGPEEARGYGVTFLSPDYLDQTPDTGDDTVQEGSLTFIVGGEPVSSINAAPGDAVEMEARVATLETDLAFSWYVSAGTLDDYGITRAAEVVGTGEYGPNVVISHNTLRIPEEYAAPFLQVYVVIDSLSGSQVLMERFATRTIEVAK